MYLLDTDHLSILQHRTQPEYARLKPRLDAAGESNIFVSIISFHEHVAGWNNYLARARTSKSVVYAYSRLHKLLDDFARLQTLDFDEQTATVVDQWKALRIRVGTLDLRIAAIAVVYNLKLLTRNTVYFERIPGLSFEDWLT